MTDIPKKKRKFKITTPGQSREYEKLSADRMFQAYEDAPVNSTANVANWDPLLGSPAKVMYKRRRKLNMDTLNAADIKVDGRTKQYREAVRRIKERQERLRERQTKSKLNQFGISENPFGKPVDEIHSPKDRAATDAAIATWKKAGGKTTQLKPGKPKGMDKSRKKLLKREEVEMNKKYLKTKEGSIEDAVLGALRVETPENPNSYRPTLTLPKKKYLETKEGSIERAVEKALTEAGATKKQVRMAKGIANDPRHKGGDMTGAWKKAEKIKKGLGDHPKVAAALRKANEEEEIGEAPYAIGTWTTQGRTDSEVKSDVGAKRFKSLQLRRKTQQAGRDRRKAETGYTRHGGSRAKKEEISTDEIENMIRFGKSFVVGEKKEVDVPDTRRTVDAIRAYDRSKDASRDADWDTTHGKKKKGDKEKKYAKKERGEIDKDDPNWKHRDYHTGMHGEETSPLIQATIDELSKKTMGSYVKKASADAETRMGNLERARGQAAATGQSADVDAQIRAHKPTMARLKSRPKGIARAADKLSKESKESEAGERDVGSSQYLKYTTDLTPGQGITSPQAKKADVAKKIEQQRQRTAATGIDDAHVPGHKGSKPAPKPAVTKTVGQSLKQKFKASRYAVRQKQARQDIATPKKEDVDLDAIIRKNLPETAVNPMGAPSNAPIGRSVIGDTAPEKLAPAKGASSSQASPSASVPGESGIEKVMDKINRIVKSGHSEKIHDKVIDKDTASAIQSTYAKVNASNQEKMEKIMSKDAAAMEKVSKFSKKNA